MASLSPVVIVALLLVVLSGCGSAGSGSSNGTGFVGGDSFTHIPPADRRPAPVVSGPSLAGTGVVSTADYPGKVVVINVWGSWCAPCRLEAPDLAEASVETADIAAFVGINIRDYQPETAQAFVRNFKVPYPHVYDPQGAELVKFTGILPANGIPTTLIIDRQGRVAARIVGAVSKSTLVTLVTDVAEGR